MNNDLDRLNRIVTVDIQHSVEDMEKNLADHIFTAIRGNWIRRVHRRKGNKNRFARFDIAERSYRAVRSFYGVPLIISRKIAETTRITGPTNFYDLSSCNSDSYDDAIKLMEQAGSVPPFKVMREHP